VDIAALSVVSQQSKLQQTAALLVMKKVMNTTKQQAGELTDMLAESGPAGAAQGHLGKNIDIYV